LRGFVAHYVRRGLQPLAMADGKAVLKVLSDRPRGVQALFPHFRPLDRPILSPPGDRYRPDIEGLRAVAVLLVVIFHAFPEALPGGFIGVDIFFVISGFLITGIVARELEDARFGLVRFYKRRIRRIFPALVVVLATVLVLGWLFMLPDAYARLSSDVSAAALFSANIALMLQSGYFDVESAKKPLLHLWSLGIEEQFYLVWPLLLMGAARLRIGLSAVAIALGLGSFVLNVALIGTNPVVAFYLPLTRAWELLAGAALAVNWARIPQTARSNDWRAAGGAALIAIAVFSLDPQSAFPGWWAVLPVAGSALLLSAPLAWGTRHLLASRPMVFVGGISYPLYLWHWPLLVFFAIVKFAPLTLLERGLVGGLSIILAWATARFIEVPIRFGRPAPAKLAALCSAMVLLAVGGVVVMRNGGFDLRLPAEIRAMAQVPTQVAKWRVHTCLLDLSRETSFTADCVDHDHRRPLLLVWGDSTAGALMPGLLKAQESRNFGLAQFTASSCVPALDVDIPGVPHCRANNDAVLAMVRKIRPDVVLLHGTWEKYLDHIGETVTALRQTGARVVVLGPVPMWKRGLPNEVLRYYMLHHRLIPERSDRAIANAAFEAKMRDALVPLGAHFVSASEALCDADGCLTRIGDKVGDIVSSDQVHLTEKGSVFLVRSIIDELLDGQEAQR
jgi:peptidoglycan/LPS O-acetylase OafA/YrhL